MLGDIPFPAFPRAISAARVNLCLTRRPHASVYASSSCRPFELAAAGAAIVASPYDGIERWFEPGRRADRRRATPARRSPPTRRCSTIPAQAEEMGRRARERVLDEHTYRHRARRLLELRRARGRRPCRLSSGRRPRRRQRRSPRVRRIAIVPALNEERSIGGLLGRAARARPRARGRRRLRRVDRPHRRGRRRRAARTSSGCRSTSGSAAPCRPGSGSRCESGYELAVRLDGDGQHDPAELRAVVAPVAGGEADIAIGSRFIGDAAATARRPRAGSGSACSPASSRGSPDERLTDTTSGLPGAQPPRDRALRRRAAARLPRGRGARDGDPARAARSSRCR